MTASAYTVDGIAAALRQVGIESGDCVYVISALWRLPGLQGFDVRQDASPAFFEALSGVVGDQGTIVVPTSTHNLCNTDIPFYLAETPSFERGMFSEYVRQRPGAERSFHPFSSYAAVGRLARSLTADVTRHAYGPETPEARMIDIGAKFLGLGVVPNIITTVHHVEHMMGVPYRYHKEFMHPVMRGQSVEIEPFYQFVWYRDADIERSQNRRLFERLKGKLNIHDAVLGRGRVSSYRLDDFYRLSVDEFKRDIYVWCDHPPAIRPYQK